MAEKKRLDTVVVELGFAETRSKASAIIMSGEIYVNGQKETKAGYAVKETDKIEFKGKKMPFVSRGGYKLEKAMKTFPITLTNTICMDIGASTGGFTDCMLQCGADKVYAIDVGYGQLAWKLRTDERVVNLERTNFRYLTKEIVTDDIDFASIDVSFISLKKILPVLFDFLKDGGKTVALIKPQFEAGKDKVGKKGVVRDINTHKEVISSIVDFAFDTGFSVLGLDFSPIRGPEGNIEYLVYLSKDEEKQLLIDDAKINEIADKSHTELSGE
ncbi:MAG: TlyA family RNA methyltransferase [Clostridia bacterium]|nr:TlyA family RNA methyltransferase [Clostridia bacterium]